MPMKYVRFKQIGYSHDVIFTFSNRVQHLQFVEQLGLDEVGVISAGFVREVDGQLECYGDSVSLERECIVDEDTLLLRRELECPIPV